MIEYKMPKGPNELRIKHFACLPLLPKDGFSTDRERVSFLAEFTGLRYGQILDFTEPDIHKMAAHAVNAISKLDLKTELPKRIKLGGKAFVLVDPEKIGIGWHIDFRNSSIATDPVRLACLFYIPENFNYSDIDENGNLVHDIASRHELFEAEFPLDLFMRSSTFFLNKSLHSIRRSMVRQIIAKKAKRKIVSLLRSLHLFNGKRRSKP